MKTIGWYNNLPLKDFEAIVIQFIKDWISTSSPPENCDINLDNCHAIIPPKLQGAFGCLTLPKGQFLYGKHKVLYILQQEYLKNGIERVVPTTFMIKPRHLPAHSYLSCQLKI